MFLKDFKLKSNVSLKGSDVKKFRQRIETEYPNANSDLLIPLKSNVAVLKLIIHSKCATKAYCVNKLPIFFENEENKLVPTVYSLWQFRDLLPYYTINAGILPKLHNGADLMLDDIMEHFTGMNIYGHHDKGKLVAVNLNSNMSTVGVGYLLRSSEDLYMGEGHSVAVKMLHLFGDKLWGIEPQLTQQMPQFKSTKCIELDNKKTNKENLTENLNLIKESSTEDVDALKPMRLKDKEDALNNNTPNIACNIIENASTLNTPEVFLKHAFLSALKNHGKSLQLPLLTSNFYRLYVLPEAQENLDLKKTKYKKLSNFLKEMIDQGYIVVREEAKGVDKITFIDLEHPDLVNFITDYKKPTNGADGGSSDNPLFHSELTELYVVTEATAALFTKLNYKRGEGIPANQIKKVMREYFNKQHLPISNDIDGETKSYVLDECLQKICNTNIATLWSTINSVTAQMVHSYQMCNVKDVRCYNKPKPKIYISLATRGYKKVTLVSNIECYGIIFSKFIKLCRRGAAAGARIVKSSKQKRAMLQIHGPQLAQDGQKRKKKKRFKIKPTKRIFVIKTSFRRNNTKRNNKILLSFIIMNDICNKHITQIVLPYELAYLDLIKPKKIVKQGRARMDNPIARSRTFKLTLGDFLLF